MTDDGFFLNQTKKEEDDDDEDLEEGELKDDDDDDDDDDDEDEDLNANNGEASQNTKQLPGYSNDNNNNTGLSNNPSYGETRHEPSHAHFQNYPPHHGGGPGGGFGPHPAHFFTHHQNIRHSPNNQHQHPELHGQYPSNQHHHFGINTNNNHYRYPIIDGPPQGALPMNHHPQIPPGGPAMYPRGGPGSVGPMHKLNIRCRFYSKTSNKCTWGDHCRFEHRDDSPAPDFDRLPQGPSGGPSGFSRGPPLGGASGPPMSGSHSPGYLSPSSSSSAVVYERKHRLAYELAPWNNPPQAVPGNYDRGEPGYPPGSRGFYRNHYPRDAGYGREPSSHIGGGPPYPGYPSYPSAYRAGPMGPHASNYNNKFMSSSQRNMQPDSRRSRSNKRGHDEDESSWSDSGSEDSILGSSKVLHGGSASKASKQQAENNATDEPPDQGSGTPPGEPVTEDRERQEMLLNKLKEIEDLMAKKKGEQEDSV